MPDPDAYVQPHPPWGTLEQLEYDKANPMWFHSEEWGEYRHKDQVAPMGVYLNPVTGSKYRGAPIAHPMARFGVHHYVIAGSGTNSYTVVASYPPGVAGAGWLDGSGWAWEERNHPNVRNHPTLGDTGRLQDRSRFRQGLPPPPTTVRQTAQFADGTIEPVVGDFDLSAPTRGPMTNLPYHPEWFDPVDEPHLDPNKAVV